MAAPTPTKDTVGDKMAGGLGDDTYFVNTAFDSVTEAANAGRDTIKTTVGVIALTANVEDLVLLKETTGVGNTPTTRSPAATSATRASKPAATISSTASPATTRYGACAATIRSSASPATIRSTAATVSTWSSSPARSTTT